MELFYRKIGEGSIKIVIVHGLFGSSDNWLTLGKEFGDFYTTYLVDARNHGNSPHSDVFNYDIMSDDLKRFCDKEGLNDFFLIGHSMGGKIAMNFISKYISLVKGAIIVDIGPKYYPPHHGNVLAGLKAIPLTEIKTRSEADKYLSKFVEEIGVRQFLLKNLQRGDDKRFKWKVNLKVIDRNIEQVGKELIVDEPVLTKTLFIRGDKSDYILDRDIPHMETIFSNMSLSTISNAGHWVQAEKPSEFLRLSLNFIESF